MARIIYAVAGEGYGHSSRAHLVGQRFLDAGHEVLFVASQKALVYLRQYYGQRAREISGLSFAYRHGRVHVFETVMKNAVRWPAGHKRNRELFDRVYRPFKPDLVLTDFEPFSAWWAAKNRVPFVSIDNEHLLTACKLEHHPAETLSRLTATAVVRCYYFGASMYVVPNFFCAPLTTGRAVLAPPIVRPAVTALTPTRGDHVVVYSTTGNDADRLRRVLSRFGDYPFRMYGFDRSGQAGNCFFRPHSSEGFLDDLASACGIISSAGASLIGECMYLRKPMLLLPVAGQYEQLVNARYAQKLGLGMATRRLDVDALERFLHFLDAPVPTHHDILWPDNEGFFRVLQSALDRLAGGIDIMSALPLEVPVSSA